MLPLLNKVIYAGFDCFHFGLIFNKLNYFKRYHSKSKIIEIKLLVNFLSIQWKCLTIILHFVLVHKSCAWFMAWCTLTNCLETSAVFIDSIIKCLTIRTLWAFGILSVNLFPTNIISPWDVLIKTFIVIYSFYCWLLFLLNFSFDNYLFFGHFFVWGFYFVNFLNVNQVGFGWFYWKWF